MKKYIEKSIENMKQGSNMKQNRMISKTTITNLGCTIIYIHIY